MAAKLWACLRRDRITKEPWARASLGLSVGGGMTQVSWFMETYNHQALTARRKTIVATQTVTPGVSGATWTALTLPGGNIVHRSKIAKVSGIFHRIGLILTPVRQERANLPVEPFILILRQL